MPQDPPISRRDLLGVGAGAAAGLLAQRLGADVPPGPTCADATAAQTSGPYYPAHDRADEDPDLTRVKGRRGRAAGELLVVQGRVLDEACKPVAGALVAGEALNDRDLIRKELTTHDQARVTVAFEPATAPAEPGSQLGVFDITLRAAG